MCCFTFFLKFFVLALSFAGSAQCATDDQILDSHKEDTKKSLPTEDYESVINEYTKYLANVPKVIKEEEARYTEEIAKIDKEIAQLRHKKVLLKSKLSDASKEHQDKKALFEEKLSSLSKFNKKYVAEKKTGQKRNHKKDKL